jgi:hypothetical protein
MLMPEAIPFQVFHCLKRRMKRLGRVFHGAASCETPQTFPL